LTNSLVIQSLLVDKTAYSYCDTKTLNNNLQNKNDFHRFPMGQPDEHINFFPDAF